MLGALILRNSIKSVWLLSHFIGGATKVQRDKVFAKVTQLVSSEAIIWGQGCTFGYPIAQCLGHLLCQTFHDVSLFQAYLQLTLLEVCWEVKEKETRNHYCLQTGVEKGFEGRSSWGGDF